MADVTYPWYEKVKSTSSITQGDLIVNCPILTWQQPEMLKIEGSGQSEVLESMVGAIQADVVVMTQACDLEEEKVRNVVLCPYRTLDEYHSAWAEAMNSKDQNPTQRAWKSHCDDICGGFVWNLTILNEGNSENLTTSHCIVDFHEVFTFPRNTLEYILKQRGQPRLRLLPPYREHLSQAFARFFMRVGLPIDVTPAW